ncbi:MAG TPA: 4Fe-4S dicluster domain-containing protein [Gemmatimonadales bacterium]|nr:4Fe-4S dicluster domain-containing protein [Gemmatimonadales bacterium]
MPPLNSDAVRQIAADLSRRDFLALLGASMALAGVTGCVREPDEPVYPYVHPPDAGAGTDLHFATAMALDGYATGLVVRSVGGRPIKIEGNPLHPASHGAAGALHQASLLGLYDPARARAATTNGRTLNWSAALRSFSLPALRQLAGQRGAGVCLVLDPTASPVTAFLLARLRTALPDATVHFHHTIESATVLDATRMAFGQPLLPLVDLSNAATIVAIGADPLASGPWHLRHARDFGARQRSIGRVQLHVAETSPSPTGSLASNRLAAAPSVLSSVALALLDRVARQQGVAAVRVAPVTLTSMAAAWVDAAAADLLAHRRASVVVAGDQAPQDVHLAVTLLNALLDNAGHTVRYVPSPLLDAGDRSHRADVLAERLGDGGTSALIITASNPVYTAPFDLPFAAPCQRATQSLYLGDYHDETAAVTQTFLPHAHYLESWGAERAYNGVISPVQPLIAPMWSGHTVDELLAALSGDARSGLALLKACCPAAATADALRRGIVDSTEAPSHATTIRWSALPVLAPPALPRSHTIEVAFPAGGVHDGRFSGNAWLQELPDPTTKLTWDNALLLGSGTAARLGVSNGDVLELRVDRATITAPALIVPGHAEDSGSLSLGYGRRGPGTRARLIGASTAPLRRAASPFTTESVQCVVTGQQHTLAVTQQHWSIAGRASELIAGAPAKALPAPLYHGTPPGHDGFGADQWAMTIDLDLCTGCSACVVACQAENNIPVVGKTGVLHSREMHWMRIARYTGDNGNAISQPMLCQHCEDAPCEYVCPVNATVHSDDGLNEMVYNRCVGTRFCSNNCPYKVRRFNWVNYHEEMTPVDELLNNPDVTVRARGVMEKCTFCVQRLRTAQERSALAGAPRTGPVVTACQQSCPTGAIIFGSLTNPDDAVAASAADPRAFRALDSLGTRPRVHYLTRRKDPA